MIIECTLICCKHVGRMVPINYVLLATITGCQSYLLSEICGEYTPESVFLVFFIASVSFAAVTLYALFTKRDVTIHYSMMFGACACLLVVSILLLFTNFSGMLIFYSALGTIVTLLFVVVDTQMIINDKKYGIGYDDFIVAALVLYLDFI